MPVITHTNNPILLWYAAGWVSFCLVALGILAHDRVRLRDELSRYWEYLTMPWKVMLFVPALLFVTFAGRFTDDETWDVVSGGGMSVLTPILLISIPLILIAGFVLIAFVQWTIPWRGR